jgi:hypothetical protein
MSSLARFVFARDEGDDVGFKDDDVGLYIEAADIGICLEADRGPPLRRRRPSARGPSEANPASRNAAR